MFPILTEHQRLSNALSLLERGPTAREWIKEIGQADYLKSSGFRDLVERLERLGRVPTGTKQQLRELDADLDARIAAVNNFVPPELTGSSLATDPVTLDFFMWSVAARPAAVMRMPQLL